MENNMEQSNRERKAEELTRFMNGLETESLDQEDLALIISYLDKSAEGLQEVHPESWCVSQTTMKEVHEEVRNAFVNFQNAIELIENDFFENEWKCDFSLRIMHRSFKLSNLKRSLTNAQKESFRILETLTKGQGVRDVLDNVEDFNSSDFKFKVRY
jgi:hypothetical protein